MFHSLGTGRVVQVKELPPMRAAVFYGPRSIEVADRPDPVIHEPTDGIVRVVLARMRFGPLVLPGRVAACSRVDRPRVHRHRRDIGSEVDGIARAARGSPLRVLRHDVSALPGGGDVSLLSWRIVRQRRNRRGQGEAVRVPLAGSSLIPVPGSPSDHSDETLRSLLALSDVMCTGHHAAVCGRVAKGDTVAVVGDGAVGLSAVLASNGSAPNGSSPGAATRSVNKSPASSAPPTSWPSGVTRQSLPCSS